MGSGIHTSLVAAAAAYALLALPSAALGRAAGRQRG
jgi:hypothetical protein